MLGVRGKGIDCRQNRRICETHERNISNNTEERVEGDGPERKEKDTQLDEEKIEKGRRVVRLEIEKRDETAMLGRTFMSTCGRAR